MVIQIAWWILLLCGEAQTYGFTDGYCSDIGCNIIQTYTHCKAAGIYYGYGGVSQTHSGGRLPGCFVYFGGGGQVEFNYNLADYGNDWSDTSSICNCGSLVTIWNGPSDYQGNVYLNGQPICDTDWDILDADVVCRQTGYTRAYHVYYDSYYGAVSTNFVRDELACAGNEVDILSCPAKTSGISCSGNDAAGVHCWTGTTYNPTPHPTWSPTYNPTYPPTYNPTRYPTYSPTYNPTYSPTNSPTPSPTNTPTVSPTVSPTTHPTFYPTMDFQIEWWFQLDGLYESDLLNTRTSVGKAIGLDLEQVLLDSYFELSVQFFDETEESISNWEVDYKLQVWTIEDARMVIDYLNSYPEIIEEVMKLELEADLQNRTVNVTIAEQNITMLAFTDPPTNMPTLKPSLPPTLSPTRNAGLPPTEEPTNFPSTVPTRRPSYRPTEPPSPVPTSLPDIRAVTAEFDSTGLSISVTFDTATSQPGAPNSFDCAYVLAAETVDLLGTKFAEGGARCEWSSKLVLIVYTGNQAVIMPGQNLTLLAGTDCDYSTICTEFQTYPINRRNITVLASPISDPVEVSLIGPAAIGLCQNVTVTMTYTGGAGRDLDITWGLPEELANYSGCDITIDEETLFVEESCIEGAGVDGRSLDFEVQVVNWMGATDTAIYTTYYSGSYIPDIALRGSISITANPLDELEVPIDVDMPDCAPASAYDFEFFWRQTYYPWTASYFGWDSETEINTDTLPLANAVTRKNLVISSGTMEYDNFYVFKLTATGVGLVNDYNYIGIQADLRPLAVAIVLDEQPLTTDQAFSISGLDFYQWADLREANDWWQSSDLDADSEIEAIELLYEILWTCNEVDTEDGVEVLSDCNPNPLTVQATDSLTLIWNETVSEAFFSDVGKMMRFSINVTDSYGRSATNEVVYVITQRKYPKAAFASSSVVISMGEMAILQVFVTSSDMSTVNGVIEDSLDEDEILSRYSLSWSTSEDSFDLSEETGALTLYSTSAAVDSSAPGFSVGATYTIEVAVIPGVDYAYEGSVTTSTTVRVNSAPSSGVCSLDLYDGIAYETQFTVSCSNWADTDNPLKHSFVLLTIDNNTNVETSSTPLINLSDLPSFTFSTGPGVFRVRTSIVDNVGATTDVDSDQIIISLDDQSLASLEADPATFLSNVSSSNEESFSGMAYAGDLSAVAGTIATLTTTMDLVRDQNVDTGATTTSMQNVRRTMSEFLYILLINLIPTIDTFITLADMLKTVVREIEELGEDAVGSATETASDIIEAMINLLEGNLISNFPTSIVESLMDSCTNMMVKGADLGLADDLSALFDAAQTTLLESLTDTLPGQNGLVKEDALTKINAQRKTPDEISEASTEYADLPTFPELESSSSADCVMRSDTFDVYSDYNTTGDIVSVNLYDSSEQADSRRRRKGYRRRRFARRRSEVLEINDTDECEPIILVISTSAFADPSAILGDGKPNISNTTIEFPECISTPTSDPTAIGEQQYSNEGCTIIAWTSANATCSCTHLSAFGSDMSEFLPDFSVFTDPGISDIDLDSLARNPMVVVMSFLLIYLIVRLLPFLQHKASDKHLLAHQFIWADRRYMLVKESAFFQEFKGKTNKSLWIRWSLLYRHSVRNSHPMLSIMLRQTGTNFTAHQRTICILSSLATCLAVNAIFYGQTFEAPATETATTVFVAIIAAIVPTIGKMWFQKHKMATHTAEKQEKLIEANKRLEYINYYVGCYCCCYCCEERINRKKQKKMEKLNAQMETIKTRVMAHDSMKRAAEGEQVKVIKKVGTSLMRTFRPYNHEDAYRFDDTEMQRKISRTVQIGLQDNPFLTIPDMFKFFDRDNRGFISRSEFEEAVAVLEQNYDKERNQELMLTLSKVEYKDTLSYEEFRLAMISYFKKRPLSEIFKHFDQDNSGYISRTEFQEALRSLGEDGSDENVDLLLRELDLDGTGDLSEKEFVIAIKENRIRKGTRTRTLGEGEGPGSPSIIKLEDGKPIVLGSISNPTEELNQEGNWTTPGRATRVGKTISLDPEDLEYFTKREREVGLYRKEGEQAGCEYVFKDKNENQSANYMNMMSYQGVKGPAGGEKAKVLGHVTVVQSAGEGGTTNKTSKPFKIRKQKNESVICLSDELLNNKERFIPSIAGAYEDREWGLEDTTGLSTPVKLENTPGGDVEMIDITGEKKKRKTKFSIKRSRSPSMTAAEDKSGESEGRVCQKTTMDKSKFMLQDSEFWISNRAVLMVGWDLSHRDLRRVKNWEMKLLVETQEDILRRTFKMPKKLFNFVWCCFVLWVIFTIGVIFVWGVNMDSDATDYPEDDLVEAATSNCDTRATITGEELNVDISADDALNLEGAQNTADETNENFERYNNIDILAWIPDLDILPDTVPESYRFVTSSVFSWLTGTVFFPILHYIINTFLLAVIYRREHSRLIHLLQQKDKLVRTTIDDFDVDDKLFWICCWPEGLLDLLSNEFPDDEKIKLKIHKSPAFERVLEVIAKNIV